LIQCFNVIGHCKNHAILDVEVDNGCGSGGGAGEAVEFGVRVASAIWRSVWRVVTRWIRRAEFAVTLIFEMGSKVANGHIHFHWQFWSNIWLYTKLFIIIFKFINQSLFHNLIKVQELKGLFIKLQFG